MVRGGIFPDAARIASPHHSMCWHERAGPRQWHGGHTHALGVPAPRPGPLGLRFILQLPLWAYDSVLMWASPVCVHVLGFFLLLLVYAFLSHAFSLCFTCFQCMFLQHVKSTGTSGIWLVAKVYVCINVSITTANKIPQAYPLLVLKQKLRRWLLIRSCYYANYISKMPCL